MIWNLNPVLAMSTCLEKTPKERRVDWDNLIKVVEGNLDCSKEEAEIAIDNWLEAGDIVCEPQPGGKFIYRVNI